MRFIKKTNIDNIYELADIHKEFELYTDREDFIQKESDDNLEKIKKIYDEKGAIITAIHCPTSKYKTKLDGENGLSTNYMSWCEILGDDEEKTLFLKICKFAQAIAEIYNDSNNDSRLEKDNETDSEFDDDNQSENKVRIAKVIIILHTGCVIGCCENPQFKCPYAVPDIENCFENSGLSLDNPLWVDLQSFDNIEIVFENITPFCDGKENEKNFGYGYENFILAEKLNEVVSNKMFGVAIDFCHIFATHELLEIQNDKLDYFNNYMEGISEERRKIICLFHLSKYDSRNNSHGGIFSDIDEDQKIIGNIRDWCIINSMNTPITLEVADSDDTQRGNENFFKVMLNWSKLHIRLNEKIDDELVKFFENLYEFYSLQINKKNKDNVIKIACDMRDFILEKSTLENKMFNFNREKQNLDIYLLQAQSYIYYIRYCNLALDLVKKYQNQQDINIAAVLQHYMFSDELGEIRFDGLGSYYKIYWIKRKENLYRCYDGCNGGNITENDFKKIIKRCFEHITGSFDTTKFLSFSKTFGRVMIKYFDPNKLGKIDDKEYNITIIKEAPINCFFVNDTNNIKEITLQEYQESQPEYTNFSIDFSDFYNGRGDSSKEASLKELYEKVGGNGSQWRDSSIGSIYDQEVILCNTNSITSSDNILRYKLNALEFIIMMVSYSIILNWSNKKGISVESIVKKTSNSQSLLDDAFVKQYNNSVHTCKINDILNTVNFEYERKNKISDKNEGFSKFAKEFICFYKGIEQKNFYKEIVKAGDENDVFK